MDLNHRTQREKIYSLPVLTAHATCPKCRLSGRHRNRAFIHAVGQACRRVIPAISIYSPSLRSVTEFMVKCAAVSRYAGNSGQIAGDSYYHTII